MKTTFKDFLNESVEQLNKIHSMFGGEPDNTKPSIFQYTIYRLPTKEELEEFKNFNLSAEDINQGFGYTIVGRGMMDGKNKQMVKTRLYNWNVFVH